MTNRQLCVVFDIDETIAQYHKKPMKGELMRLDSYRNADDGSVLYFRPGFRQFLELKDPMGPKGPKDPAVPIELKDPTVPIELNIALGIWTYGNAPYAKYVERAICEKFNLDKSPFRFVYSADEIHEDLRRGYQEKDVRRIMESFPGEFTEANTFLVDNRPANVHHRANCQNGFIVESFDLNNSKYNLNNDRMFSDLKSLCKCIVKNQHRLPINNPLFSKNNIKLMCLRKYHRKYKVGNEIKEIMSSETVDEDENFIRVKEVKQRTKKGIKVKVQRKITHKKK